MKKTYYYTTYKGEAIAMRGNFRDIPLTKTECEYLSKGAHVEIHRVESSDSHLCFLRRDRYDEMDSERGLPIYDVHCEIPVAYNPEYRVERDAIIPSEMTIQETVPQTPVSTPVPIPDVQPIFTSLRDAKAHIDAKADEGSVDEPTATTVPTQAELDAIVNLFRSKRKLPVVKKEDMMALIMMPKAEYEEQEHIRKQADNVEDVIDTDIFEYQDEQLDEARARMEISEDAWGVPYDEIEKEFEEQGKSIDESDEAKPSMVLYYDNVMGATENMDEKVPDCIAQTEARYFAKGINEV